MSSKDISSLIHGAIGFDPSKRAQPDNSAVAVALKKHEDKRREQREAAAVALVDKIVEIGEKKAAIDKEYAKASEAVDKEINKLLGELERVQGKMNTAPVAEVEEATVKTE